MRRHDVDTIGKLAGLPVIGTGSPRDLRTLAGAGDIVTMTEGTVVHHAGQRPHDCYLLLDGIVEQVVDGKVVASHGPGQVVGVVEVLDGEPATADAIAAFDVTAMAIAAPKMRGLLERCHVARVAVFRQLAARTRELDRQLAS